MNDYSRGCNQNEHPDDDKDEDEPFSSSSTLRRGDDANLAVYRAALKAWSELQLHSATTNDGTALAAAQEAVNNATQQLLTLPCPQIGGQEERVSSEGEYFLFDRLEAKISIQQQEEVEEEEDDDDDNVILSLQQQVATVVPGYVMVTSQRLILCAKEACDGATTDLDIVATRIDLHALSSLSSLDSAEPQQREGGGNGNEVSSHANNTMQTVPAPASTAVYVQVQAQESGVGDYDDYNSPPPLEISIAPQGPDEAAVSQKCQELFDAISKLVSLHPIDPNEDDDHHHDNNSGGLSAMMMMMMGGGAGVGEADHNYCGADSDDNDDEMIWAPSTTTTIDDTSTNNDDVRQAMLDRLDDLLVVPPELQLHVDDESEGDEENEATAEIVPGQFDDADEEDML
jgi:Regulator of volume decrease after cellular swelling